MVWAKILKILFVYVKNLGNSVFYNVTIVSALVLFLVEVIDAIFVGLPVWIQPYVRWALFGILVFVCFFLVYGYIRSKWVRKALVWVNLIEKYKRTPLLDPYWKEHQRKRCGCCPPQPDFFWEDGEVELASLLEDKGDTLAKKLDDLQTQMGLVIGAVETGDLTLKEAGARCKEFVFAAWGIVDNVTKKPKS